MRRIVSILILVGLTETGFAHRLDECLQAIRIRLDTTQVELSIDVTPGVEVADPFLAVIDADHNGQISKTEENEYGQKLLRDLEVQLDQQSLVFDVVDVSTSSVAEMKHGFGVVRTKASAKFPSLSPGFHKLSLENNHLPEISVYLVNALKPHRTDIRISKQVRAPSQRKYSLEFELSRKDSSPWE